MKKKKLWWQLPFLIFLIVGTVLIVKSQHGETYQFNQGFVFGTVYHVAYQSDKNLQPEIEAQLQKVNHSLSMFDKNSTISLVNQNRNLNVGSDSMFVKVFNLAGKVSADTKGAFDITVAPLVNAWGFGFKTRQMPDKNQVDSMLNLVGYNKVKLQNGKVVKAHPGTMLDCSAIAKGFGVDVVADYLRSKGISNFMVEIGGEIVTSGVSEKRLPWKIGINKPVVDSLQVNDGIQAIINVTNCAMATSGNYRNFYIKGHKKYAHTIDPHTGYPVQHSPLSATVLAPQCAIADAYATSFMVMGIQKAEKVLERHPELMAYLIYNENGKYKVWVSKSLKGKLSN